MTILKQKTIKSIEDILEADIIDFNRLNGYRSNPAEALRTILSWFRNTATIAYLTIEDFLEAPDRNDWPGWHHKGNHPEIGKKLWNWFYWKFPDGELSFSDSPDFHGILPMNSRSRPAWFWGDIGKVSASALAMTQKQMNAGDLWISVLRDGHKQIIIEPHYSISRAYGQLISNKVSRKP